MSPRAIRLTGLVNISKMRYERILRAGDYDSAVLRRDRRDPDD